MNIYFIFSPRRGSQIPGLPDARRVIAAVIARRVRRRALRGLPIRSIAPCTARLANSSSHPCRAKRGDEANQPASETLAIN